MPCQAPGTHLEQQVVLEDPLDRLKQVGPEGQRVAQPLLAFPQEPCLDLAPHAFSQGCHRAAGREGAQIPAHPCPPVGPLPASQLTHLG